jgi:thiol-disulfide isomerase/thioredoxin
MEKVAYLEIEDFTSDEKLKPYVNKGKPAIVMCQGNFCGFCQTAKPAFQDAANDNNNQVVFCTILIDGDKSEKDAAKLISKWDKNYRGVPTYLGFDKNGNYVKTHDGGRDKKSIEEFIRTL